MRRLFLLSLIALGPMNSPHPSMAASASVRLDFPVACTYGRTCWIQHYMDRDSTGPARDYTCGTLTYGKHNGADIRVADMAAERAGVNVLAAADGVVLRSRDGMADISVRINGLKSVEGTECGNGMMIDHGGGWQTQYCHMAKGSLIVKPGDHVKAGQPLGHIGLSGQTEFPHLHFSVWRDGVIVDPFAPDEASAGTCGGGVSLWRSTPQYISRAVINADFAAGPVDMAAIEAGGITRPAASAPYIVAYARAIGLKAGDQPSLTLIGPKGEVLAPSPPTVLKVNGDQRFLMVGKPRPAQGWPPGVYRARYVVRAEGKVVLDRAFEIPVNSP